jgi:thiol-disulfide isomerase/thioredoxin
MILINGCNLSSDGGIETGNPAPDFQLQDIEGQTVTLSSLRDSPVILNFWASWCAPCEHEMPFLQQIYEDWHSKGVILLTINLRETHSVVTQYMQSNGLSFPVLFDTDGSVGLDYNVTGIPTTFFIDKDGIIQARKLGSFNSVADIESYLVEITS